MSQNERVGLYLCECSKNISDKIDLNKIKEMFKDIPDIVTIEKNNLYCSGDGKQAIAESIKNNNVTKVIIAACSVKQHLKTFQDVLKSENMNPYLMQLVNIREHVAWVTDDNEKATSKAANLIKAAYLRVQHHREFETKQIDALSDVLVIGGGMAGVESALNLASKKRKVYLLEKNPSLGGQATKYEKSFPTLECCSCMIAPKLQEVMDNPNIEVLNYSEIEDIVGFFGNFTATIRKKAKGVIAENCIGCNACIEPCPVKIPNEHDDFLGERRAIYFQVEGATPFVPVIDAKNCLRTNGEDCTKCQEACMFGAINYEDKDELIDINIGAIVLATGFEQFNPTKIPNYNYSDDSDVYTSLQFERLISSTGPTKGKLVKRNGDSPKSLVMVHCVGSRDDKYKNYCSSVCCSNLIKMSNQIIDENMAENIKITHIYKDLTLGSSGMEDMYNNLIKNDVDFIKVNNPNDLNISAYGNNITIAGDNNVSLNSDIVVLGAAMVPSKSANKFNEMLMLNFDKYGFFVSNHKKTDPVSTPLEGVFIAGAANYPKDISKSMIDGAAAAGKIMSQLVPGEKITLETLVAEIDEDKCSGCKTCIIVCPYKAIGFDKEKGISVLNEILCRGCGTCVATCPSGAATARHFENDTIIAELEGAIG